MVSRAEPGRFIAIEGGDGAGRSTQIGLLLPWLQSRGWAPLHVGLGRSTLTRRTLRELRRGREVGNWTLALVYAADLTDQAEWAVAHALAAGFTVVADRWTTTALARCAVRGVPPSWLDHLLPTEPQPDLRIHLQVPPRRRLEREIAKRGVPTWMEAGRDLFARSDPLRGFIRYQGLLDQHIQEIGPMHGNWHTLDGEGTVAEVQKRLRDMVSRLMRNTRREEDHNGQETEAQ